MVRGIRFERKKHEHLRDKSFRTKIWVREKFIIRFVEITIRLYIRNYVLDGYKLYTLQPIKGPM